MLQEKVKSQSDWAKARRNFEENLPIPYEPEDGPYDPNDEEATEAWLSEATVTFGLKKAPETSPVTLHLSSDVLDHYRAMGEGWEVEIDRALRAAMQA